MQISSARRKTSKREILSRFKTLVCMEERFESGETYYVIGRSRC